MAHLDDDLDPAEGVGPDEEPRRGRGSGAFRLLGDLLDPEGRLRRGQELVVGMTSATKEEFVRIVSAEVRNFLDKMDAVDLLQQVVSGLTVDVSMQVKFSHADKGLKADVTRSEATIADAPRAPGEPAR